MARSTRTAAPAGPLSRAGRRAVRLMTAGVTAAALAGAAACGSPAPAPEAPDPVTVTPTVASDRGTPPEPVVPITWPLTGIEVAEVAPRPAVAVKIENTTSARPQSGLDQADVVWETIVEFEVSRLVAVFHSQVPEEVGPIRSVRPMDPAITAPLHGLLVFSGGQPGILSDVAASTVQAVSHDAGHPGMYRVSHRSAPHNVYGSVQAFMDQADADHAAAPPQQFAFAPRAEQAGAVVGGSPATTVSFVLSTSARPSWSWDAASGTWLRSENGTPATVASGARVAAVNVVSVTAGHWPSGYGAQGGAPVPTYDLVNEGEALVATGGHVVAGRWSKAAQDAPLELFDESGAPLLLAPGNTWVELVPGGSGSVSTG